MKVHCVHKSLANTAVWSLERIFDRCCCSPHTDDNAGPPKPPIVNTTYESLRKLFPNAQIFGSTYTEFVDSIFEASKTNPNIIDNLPIITSEIGDTWSYGLAADPYKMAVLRIAQRKRAHCLREGKCSLDSHAFYNFRWVLWSILSPTLW